MTLPPSPECMVCEPDRLDDPPLFLRPKTDPPPAPEEQP